MDDKTFHDDHILTPREFCKEFAGGISIKTFRRLRQRNEAPTVTQLSPHRFGIRVRHAREWQDARSRPR